MENTKTINGIITSRMGCDGHIIMDSWQREYVWKQDQWEDFLDTIHDSYNNKAKKYIGNLVYYYPQGKDDANADIVIVDGQQRLSTFTMICAALRDVCDKHSNTQEIQTTKRNLSVCLNRQSICSQSNGFLYYKNNNETQKFYQIICFRNLNIEEQKEYKNVQLYKAYNYFYNYFKSYSIEELKDFTNNLLKKLSVCELVCDDESEAYEVFTNQSLGVRLTTNDQMKTLLMDRVRQSDISDNEKNYYNDKIADITNSIDTSFYSRFLYHQKETWTKPCKILRPLMYYFDKCKITEIDNLLKFYKLDSSYDNPFSHNSLKVLYNDLEKYNINQNIKDNILTHFRNAIIRTMICSQGTGNFHEEIFANVVKKLINNVNLNDLTQNELKLLLNSYITDHKLNSNKEIEIVDNNMLKEKIQTFALGKARNGLGIFVLTSLNNYMKQTSGSCEEISISDMTIDHINAQKNQTKYCQTLGNLTILCRKDNSKKGCKSSFEQILNSDLKINQDLKKDLKNKKEWTDDDIQQRTKKLSNYLIEII